MIQKWSQVFSAICFLGLTLAFLSCEPGEPIQVTPDDDNSGIGTGNQNTESAYFLAYVNWPASLVVDSGAILQVNLLDSSKTLGYSNVPVKISLLETNAGVITDTLGGTLETSLRSSRQGQVYFKIKPEQEGRITIRFDVLDRNNKTVYTTSQSVRVSKAEVASKISKQLKFEVLNPIINADGYSQSSLKIVVKNSSNHPLVNVPVDFRSTGGVVGAKALTDSNGIAMGWLRSERINDTVFVTATVDNGNQTLTETQSVVFSGMKVLVKAQANVAKVNEIDSLTFELRDGNDILISNDTITIKVKGLNGFENSSDTVRKVVTDAYGQYKTWITSTVEKDSVNISAFGLGAVGALKVAFTKNSLKMNPARLSLPGDDTSKVSIQIAIEDGNNQPIPNAEIKWSTTFGSFTGRPINKTDQNGNATLELKAPKGTGNAIVTVEATANGKLIAVGNTTIKILPLRPTRLELKLSPDNIRVGVGEATLTANAYNANGDIINDLLIGFRLIRSAGGGDELITNPVSYTKGGAASTIFRAGNAISSYQGVKLTAVALGVNGTDTTILASADTLSLTISGPPAFVSLGANIHKGVDPNDGTFELPIAAVVTDINGNLVTDGTKVNFSLVPSAYLPNLSEADLWSGPVNEEQLAISYSFTRVEEEPYYAINKNVYRANLPWRDYNNNLILDEGESGINGKPSRGEDINGNGRIDVPPESYHDLNGNGVFDDGTCPLGSKNPRLCNYAEPYVTTTQKSRMDTVFRDTVFIKKILSIRPDSIEIKPRGCFLESIKGGDSTFVCLLDTLILRPADTTYSTTNADTLFRSPQDSTNVSEPFFLKSVMYNEEIWADYDGDGQWDQREDFIDYNANGFCECVGGRDALGKRYEYEFNFDGGKIVGDPPLPYGQGGGVIDVLETKGGKTTQQIIYPQSDANRIQVRVTAESNGFRDELFLVLPVIESGGN